MKRILRLMMVLVSFATLTLVGQAQVPAGFGLGAPRPTLSPYLNLTRGGNPAINYYGLVRPQIAAERAFQVLGTNMVDLESSLANQPVQTGIRGSFMTHRNYFMNNAASSAKPQPAVSPAPPPRSSRVR